MGSTIVATGKQKLQIDLPDPTGIILTPSSVKLAKAATDPAATIKGLPTSQQYNVQVTYADGSSTW